MNKNKFFFGGGPMIYDKNYGPIMNIKGLWPNNESKRSMIYGSIMSLKCRRYMIKIRD